MQRVLLACFTGVLLSATSTAEQAFSFSAANEAGLSDFYGAGGGGGGSGVLDLTGGGFHGDGSVFGPSAGNVLDFSSHSSSSRSSSESAGGPGGRVPVTDGRRYARGHHRGRGSDDDDDDGRAGRGGRGGGNAGGLDFSSLEDGLKAGGEEGVQNLINALSAVQTADMNKASMGAVTRDSDGNEVYDLRAAAAKTTSSTPHVPFLMPDEAASTTATARIPTQAPFRHFEKDAHDTPPSMVTSSPEPQNEEVSPMPQPQAAAVPLPQDGAILQQAVSSSQYLAPQPPPRRPTTMLPPQAESLPQQQAPSLPQSPTAPQEQVQIAPEPQSQQQAYMAPQSQTTTLSQQAVALPQQQAAPSAPQAPQVQGQVALQSQSEGRVPMPPMQQATLLSQSPAAIPEQTQVSPQLQHQAHMDAASNTQPAQSPHPQPPAQAQPTKKHHHSKHHHGRHHHHHGGQGRGIVPAHDAPQTVTSANPEPFAPAVQPKPQPLPAVIVKPPQPVAAPPVAPQASQPASRTQVPSPQPRIEVPPAQQTSTQQRLEQLAPVADGFVSTPVTLPAQLGSRGVALVASPGTATVFTKGLLAARDNLDLLIREADELMGHRVAAGSGQNLMAPTAPVASAPMPADSDVLRRLDALEAQQRARPASVPPAPSEEVLRRMQVLERENREEATELQAVGAGEKKDQQRIAALEKENRLLRGLVLHRR